MKDADFPQKEMKKNQCVNCSDHANKNENKCHCESCRHQNKNTSFYF